MANTIPGVLTLVEPAGDEAPVMFDSPHSGNIFPADFASIVPELALRAAEDAFVDELYSQAPAQGAALLCAHFPRTYIDPNRAVTDLDAAMIEGDWPEPLAPGDKTVKMGSGLVWRTCYPDLEMYDRKLTVAEVRHRIESYYRPYHAALAAHLNALHERHGKVWHVNCHSMPSLSSAKSPEGRAGIQRPEFVLGDRRGATCAPEFTELIRDTLARSGYDVRLNDPYNGAELVVAYSAPAAGRHSLQIEIKRALYMDEDTLSRNAGFAPLKANLARLIAVICDFAKSG